MRPLGWNPELLDPTAWEFLQRHVAGRDERLVGGEAALAGFWFHHRTVRRLEIVVPDQAALSAMQSELPEPPLQSLPGFVRYEMVDLMVDHALILDPARPQDEGLRAESLRDLAADRLLRLATAAEPELLVDLWFLRRARLDLMQAARDAAGKDLGLTPSALAVVLAGALPPALPAGLLRPVDPVELGQFLQDLILEFGMQVRT